MVQLAALPVFSAVLPTAADWAGLGGTHRKTARESAGENAAVFPAFYLMSLVVDWASSHGEKWTETEGDDAG